MEALKCIMTRRSIRKYKPESIPETDIRKILEAGANAPSAGNQQPWHFIVITDRGLLKAVSDSHPHAKMLANAALGVGVCTDSSPKRYDGLIVDDCGAATENMLLAAHALGYGGVWIGMHHIQERVDDFSRLLKLPEGVKVNSLISIGVPDEQREDVVRLKDNMIHYNGW